MSLPQYVTINGTSYASENLSEASKTQALNIQAVDAELARLQQQIAIAQTARNAYAQALIESVKGAKATKAAKPAAKAVKAVKAKAPAAVTAADTPKKPAAPRKAKAKAASPAAV